MVSHFKFIYQFVLSLLFIIIVTQGQAQIREVTILQTGWKFAQGDHFGAHEIDFNDSGWETVTIPHDWAISGPFILDGDGTTGKLPWKGEGWYRKSLEILSEQKGHTIYLIFDGIMAFPRVYLNGHLAGEWDYGYNSFYLDVTNLVRFGGRNTLAIYVDTRPHDSRWYPGAGIYRKIRMVSVSPLHVGIWGSFITTPIVKPHYANVSIQTTIVNHTASDVDSLQIEHVIVNPDGHEILRKEVRTEIGARMEKLTETTITLSRPKRWDIEHPFLYQVKTYVYMEGALVDMDSVSFGVRTMRFTANNGFYLNDRRVQLRGVNLHHDHGPLGAAFFPRAMERQLEIMKSMGCNAVRTSHNTAAPELLDLCDRMGLLVFNEVFDKYDGKADMTDTTGFEAFARRNIRNFVVRDRNHPSIFLWSVGNEIGDVQWNIDNGFHRLHTMVNYVRKYDPTRPVTLVCDNINSAALRHFDYYDVHSWNYGRRYSLARQLEPDKAVIISESASTVSTRGFYELPLPEEKTDFTRALQVSSYDLNAPGWAEIADDDFMWQQEESFVAGEFVWTGFDYLGEPTPYHNGWTNANGLSDREASRSSYFGIVDLCGMPKDRYYLYKSYWKPDETTVHILPHWNWNGSGYDKIPVFVYTNGDCAELFLNGQSLGKQCKDPTSKKSVERFRLIWPDVHYEPGIIKAVAYREGVVIGENMVKTAGEPARLRLKTDRAALRADGLDLSYVIIEAFDKEGNPCPLADHEIALTLRGPGRIVGVGNGNPQSFEPFQSDTVKLFYGKALVIVGSGFKKGIVKLTATSKGLSEDTIQIFVE